MRDFIKKRNREHGTTVILTTHDMQDIAALTNRVILIGKGRLLLDGTLDTLRQQAADLEGGEPSEELDKIVAKLYRGLDIL